MQSKKYISKELELTEEKVIDKIKLNLTLLVIQ